MKNIQNWEQFNEIISPRIFLTKYQKMILDLLEFIRTEPDSVSSEIDGNILTFKIDIEPTPAIFILDTDKSTLTYKNKTVKIDDPDIIEGLKDQIEMYSTKDLSK